MLKSVNGGHAISDFYDADQAQADAAMEFIGLVIRRGAIVLGKAIIVVLAVVSTYLVVTM